MSPRRLSRLFEQMIAASLPVATGMTAACSGTTTPTRVVSSGADLASDATADAATDASGGTSSGPSAPSGSTSSGCFFSNPACCAPLPVVPVPDGGLVLNDAGLITNCADICPPGNAWCSDKGNGEVACISVDVSTFCTGRRPAGLVDDVASAAGCLVGRHLADVARLERASVDAFRQLRRELEAYRAPRRLVHAAQRAARDELRHARSTAALARRHGSAPLAPSVSARPVRSLEAIATENAVEGCVREAFGALLGTWQGRTATDPVVRSTMVRIARDETRHAALSLDVDAWLRGRLDRAARTRVEQARRDALEELAEGAFGWPAELRAPLGLPSHGQARDLARQMARLRQSSTP